MENEFKYLRRNVLDVNAYAHPPEFRVQTPIFVNASIGGEGPQTRGDDPRLQDVDTSL